MSDRIRDYLGDGECGAVFSPCRLWRYTLWRRWNPLLTGDEERLIAYIGLNPSTADERQNDPTITRLIGFAQRWQYDGMVMLNAFAWRETDRLKMLKVPEPVGEQNDEAIVTIAKHVDLVVACWGNEGAHLGRSQRVHDLVAIEARVPLHHFGLNQGGEPKHPLYLKSSTELERF